MAVFVGKEDVVVIPLVVSSLNETVALEGALSLNMLTKELLEILTTPPLGPVAFANNFKPGPSKMIGFCASKSAPIFPPSAVRETRPPVAATSVGEAGMMLP